MRLDKISAITMGGYVDFESAAQFYKVPIQLQLNSMMADGREGALTFAMFGPDMERYYQHLLPYVQPAPDEANRKLIEKSLLFGAYLGVLLAKPYECTLDISSVTGLTSTYDRQLYINTAPREYLPTRPSIKGLIDRNLLQPALPDGQSKLVETMAGLAVLQCEESRLDEFLQSEDEKLAQYLEAIGGILPDSPSRGDC